MSSLAGTLFWILVIALQVWLVVGDVTLFGPPPARLASEEGERVAELVSVSREVRLKRDRDVVWNETRGGEPLTDGQSVMTLEQSSAEVEFKDGSGLVIGEDSLVQIRSQKSAGIGTDVPLLVSLVRGSVRKNRSRGAGAAPMAIQLGDSRVTISPESELSLSAASQGAGYRLEVAEGQVEIETSGGVVRAGAGDRVTFPEGEGQARVERLTLRALFPPDQEMLAFESERREVEFRWSDEGGPKGAGSGGYALELARDESFTKNVVKLDSRGSSARSAFGLDRDSGAWYWRVRSGDGRLSETRRLWLRIPPIPVAAYPRAGDVLEIKPEGVGFSWDLNGEAAEFEIRVETKEGKEAGSIRTGERSARIEGLAAGRYRWLVRAIYRGGTHSPWSEWREFRLLERVPDKLPAPKPLGTPKFIKPPKSRGKQGSLEAWRPFVAGLLELIAPSASAADRTSPNFSGRVSDAEGRASWDVVLEWSAVEGADGYKVQVSRTRGFREIVSESTTQETRWSWNYRLGMENTRGRVFYRVAAIDIDGAVGEFSEPIPVEVPREILAQKNRPAPKAEPTKAAHTAQTSAAVREEPAADWRLSAAFKVSFSNFSQTSEAANLSGVSADSWYPHQGLRVEAERTRSGEGYAAILDLQAAGFSGSETQGLDQPEQAGLDVGLWAFDRSGDLKRAEARWSYGVMARYSYRWERTGDEVVTAASAFSGGPALGFDYVFPWSGEQRLFAPDRLGARLGVPLVGLALEPSFWGGRLEAGVGWDAFELAGVPLEVTLEGFFDYSIWRRPESTTLSRYGASLGLTANLID